MKSFNEGAETEKQVLWRPPLTSPTNARVQFISADRQKVHLS